MSKEHQGRSGSDTVLGTQYRLFGSVHEREGFTMAIPIFGRVFSSSLRVWLKDARIWVSQHWVGFFLGDSATI
jgi:hypothetical protein